MAAFEAVLFQNQRGTVASRGRFLTGALFALGVHAALLAAALFIHAQVKPEPVLPAVVVFHAAPGPKVAAAASAAPASRPRAAVKPVHSKSIVPRARPMEPARASTPPEDPGEYSQGPETGVSPGGGGGGGPAVASGGGGEEIFALGTAGLVAPGLAQDAPITYPNEARAAHVEGTVLARCVIRADGVPSDCRILKGLPFLDAAVLKGLGSRRYRPATFEGRPVSVVLVVTLHMRMGR